MEFSSIDLVINKVCRENHSDRLELAQVESGETCSIFPFNLRHCLKEPNKIPDKNATIPKQMR